VPANVALLGSLDEASKSRRMSRWAIGLNPLSEGGGASLKVPDYMAHGNAVVSTPVGCRGVPVAEEDCGIVCQLSGFQAAVGSLLASPAVLQRQRHNAAEFASRHLSWSAVSAQYRARLSEIWRAPTRRGQSMLVVTYRYTEPALGGAEEYLIEVLGRMRPHFSRIDLAAVNVGHLTNHHHFASKFSTDHAGGSTRIASLFDRATFAAPDVVPEQVLFDECRELERYWTREQQHLHAPFAMDLLRSAPRHPRLFSGFYWPENHAGVVRRWTSTEFAILIPGNIRVVRLLGWSPVAAEMTVSLTELLADGAATTAFRTARSIEANFSVSIEVLPSSTSQPRLLTFSVGEFRPDGDHRVLGVLLEQVSVLINEATDEPLAILTEYFADIGEEVDLEIRQSYFPRWVRNLRDVAISRSDHAERLFRDVRGPSSVALRTWIAQHAQDYDTVLVQGVPFDVLPSTVEALTGLPRRPRLVVLPHFHGDDRFYYWRQYLDAFNAADATLMFSSSLSQVVDAGSAVVVPGGGVRLDEIADPAARHHFESVYPKRRPFFLVLGRKTPSKGYRVAVDAYALARDAGLECDLVLIGPDEDGLPIDEQGVTYLGRQPRDVVRGALASCVGLINMSSSESFGIVLCEAWLFGKPVIANRACYSFRDLVKDGQTGLLAGDVHELGAAMQMLAHNPGLTARLGEAGFLDAVTNYSWWSVANAVSKVIIG